MRWGMVINLTKCAGCYACVIKCKQEHFLPPDIVWGRLLIGETGEYPTAQKHMYPVLCNHCKEPRCVEVCPTGATEKREDGIVVIEQEKCAGCRYCLVSCPYQARSYLSTDNKEYYPGQGMTEYEALGRKLYPHQIGVVTKCNLCWERIDKGMREGLKPGEDREATPACVNACPAKARTFGDLDDPQSNISVLIREKRAFVLHPEYGTEPSVYYMTA